MTELVCEMFGGPLDGEIRHIDADGGIDLATGHYWLRPPWTLSFSRPLYAKHLPEGLHPVPVSFERAVYERGDISEDTHRWRYHFRGTR